MSTHRLPVRNTPVRLDFKVTERPPTPVPRYGDERLLAFVLGRPDYPRDVDAAGNRVVPSDVGSSP